MSNEHIVFEVYGNPIPQARPRVVKRGANIHTYNPEECESWKDSIRLQALAHKPAELLDCPLSVKAVFRLQPPKSKRKKDIYASKKPDIDNLIKGLFDALEGIIYTCDSRIVELETRKQYSSTRPGVWVSIKEMDEDYIG
jgi:Holliday junction resolvase RusA-like endonuclease